MTDNTVSIAAARRSASRCPICGAPAVAEMRPFCSRRCADIDLGRWLGEAYRVPAVEVSPEEAELLAQGEAEQDGGEEEVPRSSERERR